MAGIASRLSNSFNRFFSPFLVGIERACRSKRFSELRTRVHERFDEGKLKLNHMQCLKVPSQKREDGASRLSELNSYFDDARDTPEALSKKLESKQPVACACIRGRLEMACACSRRRLEQRMETLAREFTKDEKEISLFEFERMTMTKGEASGLRIDGSYRSLQSSSSVLVFISHAGEQKLEFAGPLKEAIEKRSRRVRCFLDNEDLPGAGDRMEIVVRRKIREATVGVFVLSPEFAAKKWPVWELEQFLKRREAAEHEPLLKPQLYPIFYKLSTEECKNKELYKAPKYRPLFEEQEFLSEKRQREEGTPERAMELLEKIREYGGSIHSKQYLPRFIEDVANKVIKLASSSSGGD